jgi:predicted nucleotidyltransferase
VILFGPYARGEPDAESDLDFLVVQQDGFSHRREIVRFQETLRPLRIPAEVLVVSHEEAAQPERAGDAVRDALTEGEALENDELVHEAPAIVSRQTPSALAHTPLEPSDVNATGAPATTA